MQNQIIETMMPQVGAITDMRLTDADSLECMGIYARPESVDLRLSPS